MATSTDVPIYTNTLTGPATSIVIDLSAYQNYKNLKIVSRIIPTTNLGPNIYFRFNNDSGSHYSWTYYYGNGSSPGTGRQSNQAQGLNFASSPTSSGYMDIMYIMNYSDSSKYKTTLTRSGDAGNQVNTWVNYWRGSTGSSTEAITSITLFTNSDSFAAGTTVSVYGIGTAGGGDSTSVAQGGTVYSDSTYYYHLFDGSGTFTPLQPVTADVLVIAGGGGGALASGGAGGVQLFTSQSISTKQTVTVGAGGAYGHCGADGTTGITGSQGGTSKFGSLTASVGGGGGGALSNTYPVYNATGGGSGGGAGVVANGGGGTGGSGTAGQGYAGGNGYHMPGVYLSSGGAGGAGGAGANYSGSTPGTPGPGVTTYSAWGLATNTGHNVSGTVWYASGGQATGTTTRPNGGGGVGTNYTSFNNALPKTGSGGGCNYGPNYGGAGGSGIVIVRYAK